MVDNKRKRGRKLKSPIPETLDHQSTKSTSSPPSIDELNLTNTSTPNTTHHHHLRRRRNPSSEKPDKTLINGNGNINVNGNVFESVMAMARVVPAMDAVVKVFCTHTRTKLFTSFAFLFVPWYFLEQSGMQVPQIQFNFWIFFSNAVCALALNFSIFLVIGRTGAVAVRVVGVLKDWILIALSTVIFPESAITGLNIIGYAIALCGVVMYNYIKVKDSQLPPDTIPERMTKFLLLVGE